jgi:hypothetical protein
MRAAFYKQARPAQPDRREAQAPGWTDRPVSVNGYRRWVNEDWCIASDAFSTVPVIAGFADVNGDVIRDIYRVDRSDRDLFVVFAGGMDVYQDPIETGAMHVVELGGACSCGGQAESRSVMLAGVSAETDVCAHRLAARSARHLLDVGDDLARGKRSWTRSREVMITCRNRRRPEGMSRFDPYDALGLRVDERPLSGDMVYQYRDEHQRNVLFEVFG